MAIYTRCIAIFSAVLWIAWGAGTGTAAADTQVNTYTTGHQKFPSVSVEADGGFVIVWQSEGSSGTDSSELSIQGQRYSSGGVRVGGEFQVNTYTTDSQQSPEVSLDADGDFVVVWRSEGSSGTDSSADSIQGQRYASDGSAVGGEFQINTYTTNRQDYPSIAMHPGGDFIVVWRSNGSATTPFFWTFLGQRCASDGSTIGGQFQVNTYTTEQWGFPDVAMEMDGDFVVVWVGRESPGTDPRFSIQGQRFSSDGSEVGGQFQVNTYTTDSQFSPSVSLEADGDFVVVWSSFDSATDPLSPSIQGQRYASDGSTVGGQFQVNSYTSSSQNGPSVSSAPNGDFVVFWWSYGSGGTDSSNRSIQGQRYASDGSAVGGEFQFNTYTTGAQYSPSVAMETDSDFIVVWASAGSASTDSSEFSIQSRRTAVFADGFESGDLSAWSSIKAP